MLILSVKMKTLLTPKKTLEKQKLNFSPSALFHLKTRVSRKYCLNDCRTHTRKLVASYLLEIEIFGIKFGMCDKTAVTFQLASGVILHMKFAKGSS